LLNCRRQAAALTGPRNLAGRNALESRIRFRGVLIADRSAFLHRAESAHLADERIDHLVRHERVIALAT
jgi:hypothetical protein